MKKKIDYESLTNEPLLKGDETAQALIAERRKCYILDDVFEIGALLIGGWMMYKVSFVIGIIVLIILEIVGHTYKKKWLNAEKDLRTYFLSKQAIASAMNEVSASKPDTDVIQTVISDEVASQLKQAIV